MSNYKIAVVGLGYVGLPLSVEFGKKITTIGYDINQERVEQLQKGIDSTLEIDKLEINKSFNTFTKFESKFFLKNKKQTHFFKWLEQKNILFKKDELLENWDVIEIRIKSQIAGSIWGKSFMYKILLENDIVVQEGLIRFDDAKKIITQN